MKTVKQLRAPLKGALDPDSVIELSLPRNAQLMDVGLTAQGLNFLALCSDTLEEIRRFVVLPLGVSSNIIGEFTYVGAGVIVQKGKQIPLFVFELTTQKEGTLIVK